MILDFKDADDGHYLEITNDVFNKSPFSGRNEIEQMEYQFFESLKQLFNNYEELPLDLTYNGKDSNTYTLVNCIFSFYDPLLQKKQNPTLNDLEIMLRVLSFIYKYYKLASILQQEQLFRILQLFLYNFTNIPFEFIIQFDINPLIAILNIAFGNETSHEKAIELFPIELIMQSLSPLVKNNIELFGNEWLIFLFNLSHIFVNPENGQIIFQEATAIRNPKMSPKQVHNLLLLISQLIESETLPIELYKEHDYSHFLNDVLKSNNPEILPLSLMVLGQTIRIGISPIQELDWRYFADLLYEHLSNDKVLTQSLWVITQFMIVMISLNLDFLIS